MFFISFILLSCKDKDNQESLSDEEDVSEELTASDYIDLGNYYDDDHYKAIDYFTKAIELNPRLAEAYSLRAQRKQILGDLKGAMLDYNIALELDPNDCRVYLNRGTLKYNKSDYRGAKLDYQNSLTTSISSLDSVASYYNIGLAQSSLKEFKSAIVTLTKSININPHYLSYDRRAYSKFMIDDYWGAIEDYNKTIELNPDHREAYYNRGLCKISLGRQESGCLDLSKAGELGYEMAYKAIQDFCR